jgi:hypothetical protein
MITTYEEIFLRLKKVEYIFDTVQNLLLCDLKNS